MKEVNEISIIEEKMLPTIQQELTIVKVNDHYEIEHFDTLIELIDGWLENIDSYQYTSDDRSNIKKLKAEANKLITSVTSVINSQINELIGTSQQQKATLNTKLSQLATKLGRGVDEEDKRYKAEKKEELRAHFEESLSDFTSLKNSTLDFEDIFISQWTNRSKSLKSAISDLNERLKSINFLIESPTSPTNDIDKIIEALDNNDWSGLLALEELIKQEKLRQERELQKQINERLEQQRKLEQEKRQAELNGQELKSTTVEKLPDVLIKIAGEDAKKAQNLLKAGGINFVII